MSQTALQAWPTPRTDPRPPCEIIMPVRDNQELTSRCLDLLGQNSATPFRIIIIDDGSQPTTARWLERRVGLAGHEAMGLIRHRQSLGWTAATNDGLAASSAPYLCLMNNDVLPAPGWLEKMIAHLEREPALGLLQPRGNEREMLGRAMADLDGLARDLARDHDGQLERTSFASGYCLLMRRQLYQDLGPFDAGFPHGLWADLDYCRRAQELGFFSAVARDALVAHLQNRTFKAVEANWRGPALEGERMFIARWGYKQGFVWLPRERLDQATPSASRQLRLLYRAADRGNVFYVMPGRGQRPEAILAAHGLPVHCNVKWERGRGWAGLRLRYLAHKGRAQRLHRGDLAELDTACLPLEALPPQAIGKSIRGR